MQEQSVTVGGETRILKKPFFVLATQNPLEMEGTYPLPEAQLDRFFFKLQVRYLSADAFERILDTTTGRELPTVNPVFDGDAIVEMGPARPRCPGRRPRSSSASSASSWPRIRRRHTPSNP